MSLKRRFLSDAHQRKWSFFICGRLSTEIFGQIVSIIVKTLKNVSVECVFKTAFHTYDVMELAMDIDNISKK